MDGRARRLPHGGGWATAWRRQRPRFILLAPLAMVAGAAWYLRADHEPQAWAMVASAGAFGLMALALWAWPTPRLAPPLASTRVAIAFAAMLCAAAAVGAGAAQLKAYARPDTVLRSPVEAAQVNGFILARDRSGARLRLTLAVTDFAAEGYEEQAPRRVRVSLSEQQARFLTPGRAVSCRARLGPASPPLAPGTYDFERRAFFDGLDGVGFALGPCRPMADPPPAAWPMRAQLWLAAVRADIAAAIVAEAPTEGGALAAAMIVGDRSFMSEEATTALQDSGLAHIISVSGLHMAVVGGFVFFVLKRGLALFGWLALRVPVAKVAALGALGALLAYLALSGSSVPAQRAAIMAAVAFGAVLIDRPPISMRGLGLAACLIVLISPQAVVEPGFQMSFAATLALVAAYEMLAQPSGPRGSPGPLIGGMQAFGRAMSGAVATSAVAGAATELFAIQHFQRLTLYGLPVNLAASPVIAFVVAPGAVAAGIAAPLGLAGPPLRLTAAALDGILALAAGFASRPEAVQGIAPLAPLAFAFAACALVWVCLWRGIARAGAGIILAVAVAAQLAAGPPIVVFDGEFSHVYLRPAQGPVAALTPDRQRRFERERLLALLGAWPRDPRQGQVLPSCGDAMCPIALQRGAIAVWISDPAGFAGPCPRADLVLTPLTTSAAWRARCGDLLILDARARGGRPALVRLGLSGPTATFLAPQPNRPWRSALGVAAHE